MPFDPGEGPSNPKASKEHAAKVKGKPDDDKRDKADHMDVKEDE